MNGPHEEWLAKAEDDLKFARIGLEEKFFAQVCFLSQQVIEKCLKATLISLGRAYPKSHNLRELSKLIPELSLQSHYESLTVLDGYYVPLRYPDAAPGTKASGPPNKEEATEALKIAENIWDLTTQFIFSR